MRVAPARRRLPGAPAPATRRVARPRRRCRGGEARAAERCLPRRRRRLRLRRPARRLRRRRFGAAGEGLGRRARPAARRTAPVAGFRRGAAGAARCRARAAPRSAHGARCRRRRRLASAASAARAPRDARGASSSPAGAGMSDTTAFSAAGAPSSSGGVSWSTPTAIAATVAAAASGHQRRRAALASRAPTGCGCAPASRRAAARIAASSGRGGLFARQPRAMPRRRADRRAARDRPASAWSLQISELDAKLRDGVADAALDGLDARAGQRRDLRELEPAFLVQQERLALHGGQRGARGLQPARQLARAGARFGLVVARGGNGVERIVRVVVRAGGDELDLARSRANDRSGDGARSDRATS